MELYLVRHGPAAERDPARWPDDHLRPLSPEGIRETRRAAKGFAREVGPIARYLTSPAVRAHRTAEIFRDAHDPPPRLDLLTELEPEGEASRVLASLSTRRMPGPIALFGHEPLLGELLGLALSSDPIRVARLGKSGAAALEFPRGIRPGAAELKWLLTRRQLAALAG
ncbi:MAG: SixA phosphatase family protein [Thermoplasmata archaeon]